MCYISIKVQIETLFYYQELLSIIIILLLFCLILLVDKNVKSHYLLIARLFGYSDYVYAA